MDTKFLEIRDVGTRIIVMCTLLAGETEVEKGMLATAGWHPDTTSVLLTSMSDYETGYDPFKKRDRTYFTAHRHIQQNWKHLKSGDVIDVQYILGETEKIKSPEWKDYLAFIR